MDIVETVDETLKITAVSKLSAKDIVFKQSTVGIVVNRVSVDEPIEKERVERNPPVVRGRRVLVILPFFPIVQRMVCSLVLVQVELLIVWAVPKRFGAPDIKTQD